jgi:hypothetical protein
MQSKNVIAREGGKMGTDQLRFVGAGAAFLLIFLAGFWLSRSGKPYGGLMLNVHKLVSVGVVVLLVITIRRASQAAALGAMELTAVVLTGLFFLGTVACGGLLAIGKPLPAIVHRLHQVTPYLTVLSTAATLYFLQGRTV